MNAVILLGGKQYSIKIGDLLIVELLSVKIKKELNIKDVLLIFDNNKCLIGNPFVQNSFVKIKILEHLKHDKITVLKFKRRKHYIKRFGHRQCCTKIQVLDINYNNS
ncbi:50S ribosomal protein L21 [Candidatus Legionella polyplacis]|uniref:Large ribosomal subunit protein bL21 n=1 Tax=Candidatus Legionella polyplacis TaxID=2005262 RepID=A0ABZ2GZ22_9GAMM